MEERNNFLELIENIKNIEKFKSDLEDLNKTWSQLTLLSQLGSTSTDMTKTKTNFNDLTMELIEHLAQKTVNKVVNELRQTAQVSVDIIIRNLFERTADIGFLSTDNDIVNFLKILPSLNEAFESSNIEADENKHRSARLAIKRESTKIKELFKEYVLKYSVYFDIVLFDENGKIVSRFDDKVQLEKSNDEILELAKTTTESYVETYKYHDFLPNHNKSLVYSYKIADDEKTLGTLALCFLFEDEMKKIFSNLIKPSSKEVLMLLDKDGFVISSSDEYHIPINVKFNVNPNSQYSIIAFAGRDYLCKTCQTNGYEGYFGLGWMGHIMICINDAFKPSKSSLKIDENILLCIMNNDSIFEKHLLEIPQKAEKIQEELNRTVWNGNVHLGKNNTLESNFSRSILKEIRETGQKTKMLFNSSISNLNQTIIDSLLNDVSFLASLSIEIMDRNLYERANDCRWWALNSDFRNALYKKEFDNVTEVLEHINSLYTVYENIFIYDENKIIIAISNPKYKNLIGTKLSAHWAEKTLMLKNSSEYCVSNFERSNLYDTNYTYIYNAPIKHPKNNTIVGGIGVVFDSQTQFAGMLKDALPKEISNNKMFSMFVDKKTKKIISSTNSNFEIGSTLELEYDFFTLNNGESTSNIIKYNGAYYIVGAKCSSGYREYKSQSDAYKNDVLAIVFILGGEEETSFKKEIETKNNSYNYGAIQGDSVDIATFYIGTKWLGVSTDEILESVDISLLETSITMDKTHHFKGTVAYKDYIVSVLDISPFIEESKQASKNKDIVIVRYKGGHQEHTIGIVVDSLGDIMSVPTNKISVLASFLIGGGALIQSVVVPPVNNCQDNLLTVLNIEKICTMSKEKN